MPARNAITSEHDDQQPPAARDRQHAAEQPHAAVEHRREDEPGEDDQQRLDQQHDQRDRAAPARTRPLRLLHLARGPADRAPRSGLGPAATTVAGLLVAHCARARGWSEVPGAARAERAPPGQRVPARGAVEREGDELGAPADILPRHRPAQPLLAASGKRLSATGRDCRPSGRRGRRGCVIGA